MEFTEKEIRQAEILTAFTKIYCIADGLEAGLEDINHFSQELRETANLLRKEFEVEGIIEGGNRKESISKG